MTAVFLQKETGVPEENLRCLVELNWTILFSLDQGNFKDNFNRINA